jgi:hypothetical protein
MLEAHAKCAAIRRRRVVRNMKYPRLFWAMVLPIACVSYPLVNWLARLVARPPLNRAQIQQAFLGTWSDACVPEPLELPTYALAVLLPAILMFIGVLLLRRLRLFRGAETQSLWVSAAAFASQLLLVVYAGYAWVYESEHGWKTQLFNFPLAQVVLGLCVAACLGFSWLRPSHKKTLVWFVSSARSTWLAWLLAAGWAIANLLCCVFTDDNFFMASRVVGHTSFQMGEFAAVINGLFPLVDFHPQYQNVLSYVLRPLFFFVRFNLTSFTLTMGALSLIGFLLVYRVLSRVTGSCWLGLALFIPWVAVSLANLEGPGLPPANSFNYYAVGPIRYFGLFLMAYLSMWYLSLPQSRRLITGSLVAGLVALNNLDFGFAAAVGFLACVTMFPPPDDRVDRVMRTLRATAVSVGCAGTSILGYWFAVRIVSGRWPNPRWLTEYQLIFARMGFNLQKLPDSGLYWLLYFTFMVAFLYAIFSAFCEGDRTVHLRHRLSTGMLAYGSIAGFGAFTYYIGRSHPSVIVNIYSAWAFVVALLTHRILIDMREARLSTTADGGNSIWAIPTVAVLALCSALLPLSLEFPKVGDEMKRLSYRAGAHADQRPARLASLIRKYVRKSEPTVIIYPDAHWLAIRASVQNVFPYAHPLSLLVKAQLEPLFLSLERLRPGHEYVFGDLIPDITDRLRRLGFVFVEADGDFAVWHRGRWSQSRVQPVARATNGQPE